jgi:hypothetical protein
MQYIGVETYFTGDYRSKCGQMMEFASKNQKDKHSENDIINSIEP